MDSKQLQQLAEFFRKHVTVKNKGSLVYDTETMIMVLTNG